MTAKSFVFVVVLFGLALVGVRHYLDRPTVEVDVSTGACVRAYGPKGPMPCKDAMSVRHEEVHVQDSKKSLHTL